MYMLFDSSYHSQVSAAEKWNQRKTDKVTYGVYTFYAHPSNDGKEAWIYQIDVSKKGTKNALSIPSKIKKRTVTRLVADMGKDEEIEFYRNLFGTYVEECHGADGSNEFIRKIPKLTLPNSITEIGYCAFSGLDSIKEVILPKSLKDLQGAAFYGCNNLKKVLFPAGCNS